MQNNHNFFKVNYRIIKQSLWLLTFSIINFLPFFIFFNKIPQEDWGYFNGLSYIINQSIFEYKTLPIYDPYVCGGLDILANPQSYLFSPLILFNFLFNPYLSNLFSVIFCAILGGFSMIKLLDYFKIEQKLQLLGALVFLSSNWFGLHYLEGHIVFRSMQLIPLAIYLVFCLEKHLIYWIYFSLLMAFFLLDGAIYCFNFTFFFLLIAILLKKPSLNALFVIFKQNFRSVFLILLAFLFLIIPKIIPVLLLHINHAAELHFYSYGWYDMFLAFFYPFNLLHDLRIFDEFGKNLRMHEYVCYLGYFSIFVMIFARKTIFLPENKKIWAFLLIFLWIGTGFGLIFNPWTIYILTPFLNNSHVQSRFLIFFYIFFVILMIKGISKLKNRNFWMILILLELTSVRLYPQFIRFISIEENSYQDDIIRFKKHNITKTVDYIKKPQIYFSDNLASKYCYEKAVVASDIRSIEDKNYLGESYNLQQYLIQNKKNIDTENDKMMRQNKSSQQKLMVTQIAKMIINEFSLQKITGSYQGPQGQTFIINTNHLLGWRKIIEGDYQILSVDGLLAIKFNQEKINFAIKYQPQYLRYILLSYMVGILIYIVLIIKKYEKNQF